MVRVQNQIADLDLALDSRGFQYACSCILAVISP